MYLVGIQLDNLEKNLYILVAQIDKLDVRIGESLFSSTGVSCTPSYWLK